MKMYILILDSCPDNLAPTVAAHGALMAHLRWSEVDRDYVNWLSNSFKKCVVSVNEKEFLRAKNFEKRIIITESSLGNQEVGLVLCPRQEFDKAVGFYKLWKPKA